MSGTSQVVAVVLAILLVAVFVVPALIVLKRRARGRRTLMQEIHVDLPPLDLRGPRAQGGVIPDLSGGLRLVQRTWPSRDDWEDGAIRDHQGRVVRRSRPAPPSQHAPGLVWDFPRTEALPLQVFAAPSPDLTLEEIIAVDTLTVTTPRTRSQATNLVLAGRSAGIAPWQILALERAAAGMAEIFAQTFAHVADIAAQAMRAFASHFSATEPHETGAERRRRERRELRDAQRAARDPRQSAMWSEYHRKTRRRNRRRRNR